MKNTAARQLSNHRVVARNIVIILIGLLVMYAVLPQIGSFHRSLSLVRHAQLSWFVAAILISTASYFAAGLVYICLAQKPLPYTRTVLVQLASMFTNRLLPAGIGALGTNYQFLRRHKHSAAQALTVVSVNNLLGFVGNMLLVGIMLLVLPAGSRSVHLPHLSQTAVLVGAVTIILVALALLTLFRKKLKDISRQIISALAHYRAQPLQLILALASSMLLTMCYTGCLYAAGQAVGIHLSVAAVLICMSAGVAGSTAVPTPGGLGGAEAGLVAGLSAYGIPGAQALAAVLLYRICTYWLALLGGSIAFLVAGRRHYL